MPCLVLRGTTEWVEAVAASDGRMVVIGLDRDRAVRELARLAAPSDAPELARARAASARIPAAGAVDAILGALG